MNQLIRTLLLLTGLSTGLRASTLSFRGTFGADDQVRLFSFAIDTVRTVDFRSIAYGGGTNAAGAAIAAGGFDSFFTFYFANGTQIGTQDDSRCGVNPVRQRNGACLDA